MSIHDILTDFREKMSKQKRVHKEAYVPID